MAERLIAGGYHVTAWNRTQSKAQPLARRGATVVNTVEEAIADADAIVLTVTDAPAIRQILLHDSVRELLDGRTVIQMGTIGPTESRELSREFGSQSAEYLEAPVLGSIPEAATGQLVVMVGCSQSQFERWLPVLECFGPRPRRIGEVGDAATLKLALNQLIASITAAYALSLGLVRRSGLDVATYVDTVRSSALFAPTFDKKLPKMLERDFGSANFPACHLLKDVRLFLDEAVRLGLATPALEGVGRLLETTVEAGHGDSDYSAISIAVEPENG